MSAIRSPAIPLSPSSPPESGLKQRQKRRLSDDFQRHPSTPPLMSVATKSYVSSYGNGQASAEQNSPSSTTSSTYTQQSTQPLHNSFPTPMSSVSGSAPRSGTEEKDVHRDKRQKMETDVQNGRGSGNSPIATNHDRHAGESIAPATHEAREGDELIEDQVQQSGETQQITKNESSEHFGSGDSKAFLLGKMAIPRSLPDPKNHLLSHFGLVPLIKTVARNDPRTGEKINKLRKSYEGQIKMFALAGRNKSVKSEALENQKRPLRSLVEDISEEHWKQRHATQEIAPTNDFKAKLEKAMKLQPGTVRNNSHWEDVLGHERRGTVAPTQPIAPAGSTFAIPGRQPNGAVRQPPPRAPDARPRRAKKRSYGDSSFEGYGDGYDDDEFDDAGANSDDDDGTGGAARKKRKKDHPSSFNIPSGSYYNR